MRSSMRRCLAAPRVPASSPLLRRAVASQSGWPPAATPPIRSANNRLHQARPRGTPAMKILPPVSVEARRLLPNRWDLLAAILVVGFLVAFVDVSRFLVH